MYSTPQIDNVGRASVLIQGMLGHQGETGVAGKTYFPITPPALEAE
ncbi:MAG TPA: hypothetical protein VN950_14855 [Terriglobales bacterium]|nr:hypothetical protein [Terriglobales bacterium]